MRVPDYRSASDALELARQYRVETRRIRQGGWFPVTLFGLGALGSTPFYRMSLGCVNGNGCVRVAGSHSANAFASRYPLDPLGKWLSIYWIITILIVNLLTVIYYRRRAASVGLLGRTFPIVSSGALLLAVIVLGASQFGPWLFFIGTFGTGPLAIIALSLIVLSRTERSIQMGLVVLGFAALVGLSMFYNIVNVLERIGLGSLFRGPNSLLPNVLVPAIYLVIGGLIMRKSSIRQISVDRSFLD